MKVSVHTTRNKGYFNPAKDISDAAVKEVVLLEHARRLAPYPGSPWVYTKLPGDIEYHAGM